METMIMVCALSLPQVVCAYAADFIYNISLKDIDGKSITEGR